MQSDMQNMFIKIVNYDLALLIILQVLHIYWFYVMMLVAYIKYIKKSEYNEMGIKKK